MTIGIVDRPVFHYAVDTAGQAKDAELVSDIIARCIDKVGAEKGALVVTDNAASCVRAFVCSTHDCIHSCDSACYSCSAQREQSMLNS
jgi:hypothetical protein